ncbi:MAG: ATP-binding protein [Bacteroidia bacterium]|nr:ATP-binding protein [Bacteroidia bacterium]
MIWIWFSSTFLHIELNAEHYLLIGFSVFSFSWIFIQLLFYQIFSKEIIEINKLVENKLLGKQGKWSNGGIKEADPVETLKNHVNEILEIREKESKYYENLDSYRKEYLGNVSHELKTPIFNIQGYIETLINGGLNDERINLDYLKRAEKSVERMINIIDDLETINQLDTGELNMDFEKVDIARLTKDIYSQLELMSSKKNIQLKFDKKYDKPIYVYADEYRIRQVLVNLITNSIKYGKVNGETVVSFSFYDDKVFISVKDNGVGIEEVHLPRLFERFYRVDKGRSREQGGTGLGLAIVKHIVEAHNSSISVKSKVGEGSEFTFYLKRFEK